MLCIIFVAKLAPAEAPQHFFLHLLLTADVPLWTATRPRVSHDLRLIGRCLQFFQLECQILSYLTGKLTLLSTANHIVGNFRGVQIFVDFVHSAYPQKALSRITK